jgi:LuxR family maltose regulon positive regulatory protein
MPLPKVLRTKITPPHKSLRTLARPRVTQALADALHFRLTLLQAGAGYGKSTALTMLAEEFPPVAWYQVTEDDSDPLVFLLHLCHATQTALPNLQGLPAQFLESWESTRGLLPVTGIVDQYLNTLTEQLAEDVLLVLDDAHLAAGVNEIALILDRLIGLAPQWLHVVLASRAPIRLPNLSRWRAQGEVLLIDQSVLAFKTSEISELFSNYYGYDLTPDEVIKLQETTEGWAIALQLIWQNLRRGISTSLEASLTQPVKSLDSLFEILAKEVFESQPVDVQEFLRVSATLREMTPNACDALLVDPANGSNPRTGQNVFHGSAAMLAYLRRQELFVVDLGDGSMRYHHIFHSFLIQQAGIQERSVWNRRAAQFFGRQNDFEAAIYHLLHAGDREEAADILEIYGAELLARGRLDTLSSYLDQMDASTLRQHPALLFFLGDLARLHSRFQEALGWYQQAEAIWRERNQQQGIARSLRGQARVYLDTVNPAQAEALLQNSIRLSDGMEGREVQARLFELLAENKLNAGHVEEAEALRRQAEALRSEGPSDSQLLFRVLLRTGRLEEARQGLEARAEAEQRKPVQTPRAHRETYLLLSLIYALEGHAEQAHQVAIQGTQRGIALESPFVTAVGHARQGHALSLLPWPDHYGQARRQFIETIRISRMLAVPRLLVEAFWGLCRVYGYQGDLGQAMQVAKEGLEIAIKAGDEWIASLMRLSMGASLILAARYEAASEWLERASLGFQECSDPFGLTAARLWLCQGWFRQKNIPLVEQNLPEVLSILRANGYDFLLTRPTLLGPPDERIFVPLLLLAREKDWEAIYVRRILNSIGLPKVELHPGFQLRVTTLGSFQAWRGIQPIPANGWHREKSRQLFQLLLTFRNAPLDRDQIIDYLWPNLEPQVAQRNFKVALNNLYQVLEPEREPGSNSAFIYREGTIYNLRPGADIWLDCDEFLNGFHQAELKAKSQPDEAISQLAAALTLFQGDYLPEARYETWAAIEREHLEVHFLRAADHLSELYFTAGQIEAAIAVCQRILTVDNCWERAYRLLMRAYARLGDHGQVARTYQRCLQTLHNELDVSPAMETEALYHRLVEDQNSTVL